MSRLKMILEADCRDAIFCVSERNDRTKTVIFSHLGPRRKMLRLYGAGSLITRLARI